MSIHRRTPLASFLRKRPMKEVCDDQATLKARKFVPEKY